MNWRAMLAIIWKDLKVVSRNKGVMLPILISPLIMFGVLPWLVMWLPSILGTAGLSANDMNEIPNLIRGMPAGLQQELAGLETNQIFVVYFLVHMMTPLFLVIPLMVSTVIAAYSFAGEKERKTMGALLYTPSTDRELFVAKLLSGWLAAIASAAAVY